MRWEIRTNGLDERRSGLSTEKVRDYLSRGLFSPEDWARPSPEAPWRQIATIDEFEDVAANRSRRRFRPKLESHGIDMTPMIDVTFLLLIFFMITATFHMQKGLDFPPDKTEDTSDMDANLPGVSDFGDHIVVEITEQDRYLIRQAASAGSAGADAWATISTDDVAEAIRTEAGASKRNKLLIISHELASHEAVVAVIDASALAGITSMALADITTKPLRRSRANAPIIRRN